MSSKTHSVIREEIGRRSVQKRRGKAALPNEGAGLKPRLKMPRPDRKNRVVKKIQRSILYSEVSFQECNEAGSSGVATSQKKCEGSGRVNSKGGELCRESQRENVAAVMIQKVFRGYITRKYINEAMFIIGKVKTIQRWWKRVIKRGREPKPSVESSLVTIKDFNETGSKGERQGHSGAKGGTPNKQSLKELVRSVVEEEEAKQEYPRVQLALTLASGEERE